MSALAATASQLTRGLSTSSSRAEAKVILAARERNENKPHFVADKVVAKMKKVTDTVGVLGLSYKPDVDDLRESPSIELCHILQEKGDKGYRVRAVRQGH